MRNSNIEEDKCMENSNCLYLSVNQLQLGCKLSSGATQCIINYLCYLVKFGASSLEHIVELKGIFEKDYVLLAY